MLRALILALTLCLVTPLAQAETLSEIAAANAEAIAKPSRLTIGPVIDAIAQSGDPLAAAFLTAWEGRSLGQRKADGALFLLAPDPEGFALTALDGSAAGTVPKSDITELKPNAGVRGLISTALVQFTLSDPDPATRSAALDSIAKDPAPEILPPLRAAIESEDDPALKARKTRLERLLTLQFDPDPAARIAAIQGFGADSGLDLRAALSQLVVTQPFAALAPPENANIARELLPGRDLTEAEAYAALVASGLAPEPLLPEAQKAALAANIVDGQVGGVPVAVLGQQEARDKAYSALEAAGTVPTAATADEIAAAVAAHRFFDVYDEPDPSVTGAAAAALDRIGLTVGAMQATDLGLDALSLASIYFLAAIGLAITFGVMGVINMAHGEFITLGAYTGYVVQLLVPDLTLSLIIALPLAFAVTFAAGVGMERLVIRHLYKRPLETLLATFGISIAIQQVLKNTFGTQARPLGGVFI